MNKRVVCIYLFVLLLLGGVEEGKAQDEGDALRYSRTHFGGTARAAGVSNAFGALGADFSALSINPAGLGLYRSSEVMFTPGIEKIQQQSNYLNQEASAQLYNFYLGNGGIVLSNFDKSQQGKQDTGWVAFNFAGGFNRVADFSRHTFFRGFNKHNSIIERYVQQANQQDGVSPGNIYQNYPFGAGLAYKTFLINPRKEDSTQYKGQVPYGGVHQQKNIRRSGGITEWNLGFAANYREKLYLGIDLALPVIRYTEKSHYIESDDNDSIGNFERMSVRDSLGVEGEGFNLKIGAIYRITERLRVGISVQSPTYYSIKEGYSTKIESQLDTTPPSLLGTNTRFKAKSRGKFEYNLFTPWHASVSIAYIHDIGFVSLDYTYRDYQSAIFDFSNNKSSYEFLANELNNTISRKYGPAHNLRLGVEFKYEKFRFRAGGGWLQSPFQKSPEEVGADYTQFQFTGGIGIREQNYSLNIAYVRKITESFHTPYTLADNTTAGAKNKLNRHQVIATVGFNF